MGPGGPGAGGWPFRCPTGPVGTAAGDLIVEAFRPLDPHAPRRVEAGPGDLRVGQDSREPPLLPVTVAERTPSRPTAPASTTRTSGPTPRSRGHARRGPSRGDRTSHSVELAVELADVLDLSSGFAYSWAVTLPLWPIQSRFRSSSRASTTRRTGALSSGQPARRALPGRWWPHWSTSPIGPTTARTPSREKSATLHDLIRRYVRIIEARALHRAGHASCCFRRATSRRT